MICVLLRGGSVYAEELPYENCHLTNNRFENTVSMKPIGYLYKDDVSNKVFKPTKKELKQAKKIYKQMVKLKSNKYMTVSSKKYKNITRLMGIINHDYFTFVNLECSVNASYKYYKYKIYGKDVKKCLKYNKIVKDKYSSIMKELRSLGINKNTTEHDAVLIINNYIVNFLKYDYNSSKDIKLYQDHAYLFSEVGVCADYATMFYYLSNMCGLKSGIVSDNNMNHAYNAVYVGGKISYLDACWNDTDCGNQYIFLTREKLLKSHKISKIDW